MGPTVEIAPVLDKVAITVVAQLRHAIDIDDAEIAESGRLHERLLTIEIEQDDRRLYTCWQHLRGVDVVIPERHSRTGIHIRDGVVTVAGDGRMGPEPIRDVRIGSGRAYRSRQHRHRRSLD